MINLLVSDIEKALKEDCFFAALTLALTLPDVCGKAEYPNKRVSERYKTWYKKYVSIYEKTDSPYSNDMPYMSEEIVYSLRNSLLHQGTPNIENNNIKEERCKVDKFSLVITDENSCDGDIVRVSYGKNMDIVEREQNISIRHICYSLCRAAENYYINNKEKFSFINYTVIDKRKCV